MRESLGDKPRMSSTRAASMPTSHTEDAPRDCGGCNVCCTAMRVAPLDKPAGTPCPHACETGCGIYHDRPSVCRVWFCMWVRDPGRIFTDAHRPDRLGVFFTASTPDPRKGGSQTIYAHEVKPDAAAGREARQMIAFLANAAPVQVVPYRPPAEQPITLTHEGRDIAA